MPKNHVMVHFAALNDQLVFSFAQSPFAIIYCFVMFCLGSWGTHKPSDYPLVN